MKKKLKKKNEDQDVIFTDKGIIIEPPAKPSVPPKNGIINSSKKPKSSSEAV